MKNLLLPFFALLLLMGCEKESTLDVLPVQEISESVSVDTRGSKKRNVCHNGNIINININAISAHQAHGDAVDMDGDGFFDIDNPCSETDCDDTIYDLDNSCACVEGELEVTLPDGSILYVYPTDNSPGIMWGQFGNDIDALQNITSSVFPPDPAAANTDFNGAGNTALIVAELGDFNNGNYAANLCAQLSSETGCEWYLPAAGELNAMYQQLGPFPNNNFANAIYWTSTEQGADAGWVQLFGDYAPNSNPLLVSGYQSYSKKKNIIDRPCRCVRR